MKKQEAEALVATIRAAYPSQQMPEATASLLVVHLKGVDAEVGAAAVNEHIGSSMFLPAIAELVAAEERVTARREQDDLPEAWVKEAMRNYGMDYGDAMDFVRSRVELLNELEAPDFSFADWERRWDDPSWTLKMGTPPRGAPVTAKPKSGPPTAPVSDPPPDVDALALGATRPA